MGGNARRAWLAAAVAVLIGVAIASVVWVFKGDVEENDISVAEQWNSAIGRLGIEPVYPPEEDISVGDLYIVVVNDRERLKLPDSLPARSVKIAHLDMRKQLEKAYAEIYQFPETNPRPGEPDAIWPQKEAEQSIFEYPATRKTLPIVLFPGFSLASTRSSSANGSWLSRLIGTAADTNAAVRRTVDLRVPAAETYGLPNLIVSARLQIFCNDWRTQPVCTQTGARQQLATVDSSVLLKIPDPSDPSKQIYRYDVALYLVSRVFMTRSVETIIASSDDFGVGASLGAPRNRNGEASGQAVGEGARTGSEPAHPDEDAKRVLDATGIAPSGSISVKRLGSQRISITQTLQRPIVIGFRAAKASPLPD